MSINARGVTKDYIRLPDSEAATGLDASKIQKGTSSENHLHLPRYKSPRCAAKEGN